MKTLLLPLFALCLLIIASATQIKGVNPNDLMKYQGSEFNCFDGSSKIARHKINDNYCDCKDGSDEPGTSACGGQSKVKFFCQNKGYISKSIFVNFVNDGICDCCDGSDEYEGRVSCPNTCRVEGEGLRKQYTEQLASIQAGLAKKKENSQEGTRQLKQIRQNLKDKKDRLTGLEAELSTLEAEKQRLEKQEEEEKNKIREQKKQEEEAAAAAKQAEAAQQPPAEQAQPQEGVEPAVVPPVAETKPPAEDAAKDYKNEEAQKARDAYDSKKKDVDNLRNEITQLENTANFDFGPNNEFFYLKDKCLSIDTREYTYEFCAYNKCAQKDKRSSSSTSLGSWNNNSWVQKYSSMKFENGQGCWQGPNRSTTVTFVCAPEDKVVKVDEPSRCVYSLLVETPSVCTTEAEQEVAAKLADLN